jgi:Cu(I)/Ag(I) efflux system membrane fusion protein
MNQRFMIKRAFSFILVILPFVGTSIAAAAGLVEADKAFLRHYATLHSALAADDLAEAKKAAAEAVRSLTPGGTGGEDVKPVAEAARAMADASSIKAAREAFKVISKYAVKITSGVKGYYHANCPMVPKGGGDWVQTTDEIRNPYYGKAMLTCGAIVE